MKPLTLYRYALSGHCHRVELLLSLLGLEVDMVEVDLKAGEQRLPRFLEKNPVGQVPVLEDGNVVLSDSNAILIYLATKYDPSRFWLPRLARLAAEVQYFLSMAAGPVAYGPAAARLVTVFNAALDQEKAIEIAHNLLATLNNHLAYRSWLVTEHPTIADVANYAYIAHAPEGNVCLTPYPFVIRWLSRIEALPGFVPMRATLKRHSDPPRR